MLFFIIELSLFLENNPEHKKLWDEFTKRNLLRKMDLAFNLVHITGEELKQMSSTDVKNVSEQPVPEDHVTFVIKVPELKKEFPALASQKSKVYPLPLSFENQCTTMGAAINLSLFREEFKFPCETKQRYLPLSKNNAEYNLDAAYERHAFPKTLSKHKENQTRYENILRRKEHDIENVDISDGDNAMIAVLESDDDSDISD